MYAVFPIASTTPFYDTFLQTISTIFSNGNKHNHIKILSMESTDVITALSFRPLRTLFAYELAQQLKTYYSIFS